MRVRRNTDERSEEVFPFWLLLRLGLRSIQRRSPGTHSVRFAHSVRTRSNKFSLVMKARVFGGLYGRHRGTYGGVGSGTYPDLQEWFRCDVHHIWRISACGWCWRVADHRDREVGWIVAGERWAPKLTSPGSKNAGRRAREMPSSPGPGMPQNAFNNGTRMHCFGVAHLLSVA